MTKSDFIELHNSINREVYNYKESHKELFDSLVGFLGALPKNTKLVIFGSEIPARFKKGTIYHHWYNHGQEFYSLDLAKLIIKYDFDYAFKLPKKYEKRIIRGTKNATHY